MSEFNVSDIVKLKSHRQEMMINQKTTDGILCVWIDDYGQPHRETYSPEVLEISDPDELTKSMRKVQKNMDMGGGE